MTTNTELGIRTPRRRSLPRAALWALGAPARGLLFSAIRLYQVTLSGWLGGQCRFHPTCSDYALGAIRARGAVVGSALALWRVVRCSPFSRGGIDPPPRRGPVMQETA